MNINNLVSILNLILCNHFHFHIRNANTTITEPLQSNSYENIFWFCRKNVKYPCGPMCKQEWPNNLLRFGESCIAKCKLQTKHDWLTAPAQKLSQKHYALHQCHVMYLLKPMEEMNLVRIFLFVLLVSTTGWIIRTRLDSFPHTFEVIIINSRNWMLI